MLNLNEMIFLLPLDIDVKTNFCFEYTTFQISIAASIILTLPSSTIILIKDVILKYQFLENSRKSKILDSGAFIICNIPSIILAAIGETINLNHHYFNIWKKLFAVFGVENLKNGEKIGVFCSTSFSFLHSHR